MNDPLVISGCIGVTAFALAFASYAFNKAAAARGVAADWEQSARSFQDSLNITLNTANSLGRDYNSACAQNKLLESRIDNLRDQVCDLQSQLDAKTPAKIKERVLALHAAEPHLSGRAIAVKAECAKSTANKYLARIRQTETA